jgi:transposase InsO family protein
MKDTFIETPTTDVPASWQSELKRGDVVAFRFPHKDAAEEAPKVRPALVLEVEDRDGERWVTLAYGSSQPLPRKQRGYGIVVERTDELLAASLMRTTTFNASRRVTVSANNPAFMSGWATLALVMDCHTSEVLGWHLSRSGKATTAASALEHALIARFGTLGRVSTPFLLRSDNGLVFTSRSYTALVRSYGLQQEFITPHCPQQNGMMERLIRSLKEQCVHRHRFESLAHSTRAIGDWIQFYNHRRPHQALPIRTPSETFTLAA